MIEYAYIGSAHPNKAYAGQVLRPEDSGAFADVCLREWAKGEQTKAPMAMPIECPGVAVLKECAEDAKDEAFRLWLSADWHVIARPMKDGKFDIEMNVRGLGRVGLRAGYVTVDKLAEQLATFHAWWFKKAKVVS